MQHLFKIEKKNASFFHSLKNLNFRKRILSNKSTKYVLAEIVLVQVSCKSRHL